jgi:hypothetical protein
MHNQVTAFDADTPQAPLWQRILAPSIQLPAKDIGKKNYLDIEWEVGIVSTPVIDTDRSAIYLVTTSRKGNSIIHQSWKLDLVTGNDISRPITIAGKLENAHFDSSKQLQRSALLLSQNKIYAAFASYGDHKPYYGWVFSFDADTLNQNTLFCSSPNPRKKKDGGQAGIWMSGQGPAADDDGNLYLMTGNGNFDTDPNKRKRNMNFGDCVLKLSPHLKFLDFFSPHNNDYLNSIDLDLGSGGVLAIPGTHMIVGGGKEAWLYLMDMNQLGGFNPNATNAENVLDRVRAGAGHIHGSPVFWNGPNGPRIYVWPEDDECRAFEISGTSFVDPSVQTHVGIIRGMPGGILTISANVSTDGIVWANHPWNENLNQKIGEGVLRAFDAWSLKQTWMSRENLVRDDFGNFAKFCPPTVAQGKVYMATMGGLSHHAFFTETAFGGPAMVNRNDDDLVLGYSDTHRPSTLNVISSTDGRNWFSKVTIPNETTRSPLALAFDQSELPNGRSFIAWTGTNKKLNVISTPDAGLQNWGNKHTLNERSDHGPALQIFNGRLFIAWTGTDEHLNVMSSADWGATWQNKRTLPEKSHTEPAFTIFNGKLILMWSGTDSDLIHPDQRHHLNFIESSNGGLNWGHKVTIGDRSDYHPAMAVGVDNVPYFCWTGLDKEKTINLLHSEDGTIKAFNANPNYKRTFRNRSANGPCLCEFKGKVFIGWTGPDKQVNVAQLSRGAVAVYGLLRKDGPGG